MLSSGNTPRELGKAEETPGVGWRPNSCRGVSQSQPPGALWMLALNSYLYPSLGLVGRCEAEE